jgi:hypothetical protein
MKPLLSILGKCRVFFVFWSLITFRGELHIVFHCARTTNHVLIPETLNAIQDNVYIDDKRHHTTNIIASKERCMTISSASCKICVPGLFPRQ